MSERTQRRLAAIVSADVVGYSRLMGVDEAGTHERLQARFRDLVQPKIVEHRGRVVKLMGDGLLAEFPSVIDAVNWALEVQATVAELDTETAADERIEYRVGVNLGDIIVDGDDIFGDGVNVAARLQEIAGTGGVCISDKVHTEVRGKVSVEFADGGAQAVKNITEPVHVWRWSPNQQATAKPVVTGPDEPLPLPDKPSIAVLPFDNMSGDPEQEYFADGITEDIITVLSKFQTFRVCARNSTFVYKGTSINIKKLSQELGVQYVVEGSVRRGGNRVRITAQLIDAGSGSHVWADRFDRELEDIFAVQDEITEKIVAAVAPEVLAAEILRAQKKDTKDLGTWDAIVRARWHLMRFSRKDSAEAKRLLGQATQQDPNNVVAWSDFAWCHLFDFSFGWSDSVATSLEQASQASSKAIALDRNDGRAQTARGIVALFSRRHDEAAEALQKAIDLNASDPVARGYLGLTMMFGGESAQAFPHFQDAMRLSPRDHFVIIWLIGCAFVSFSEERYDEAIDWLRKARQENPQFPDVYALLAASHAYLDEMHEASVALDELLGILPGLTSNDSRLVRPFKQQVDRVRFMNGLRKAGLDS